jgi:hypothetical protein
MSQGSPRKTMRFPAATVDRIEAAILSANDRRAAAPYDWTAWVLKAVAEKLAHLDRSKKRREKRRPRRRDATTGQPVDLWGQTIGTHASMSRV